MEGRISLKLDDVPWDQALEMVLRPNDLTYQIEDDVIWLNGDVYFDPEILDLMFQSRESVCLVNVSESDWEATTLVIRSDIDLIVKSSRKEILVFAQDMVKGESAFAAAREGYGQGKFSFLDMLDAQRELFKARVALVDALSATFELCRVS